MNEIKLKLKNKNEFIKFIKNFQGITDNLLIELKLNNTLCSKAFPDERNFLKRHSRDFDTMFETEHKENKLIFIGIYSKDRFLKILSLINDNSDITLKYLGKKAASDTIDISTIEIVDGNLVFNIDCAEFKLFTYLDDEKFDNSVSNTDECDIKFNFPTDVRKTINEYSDVDSDDSITFTYLGDGKLRFSGQSWKYDKKFENMESDGLENKTSYTMKKSLFRKLNNLDYDVYIKNNKTIFKNSDNDEIIVISHSILDED